jgi:nitrate/TMAO reductase-like tetraheme cytochrome c subunit
MKPVIITIFFNILVFSLLTSCTLTPTARVRPTLDSYQNVELCRNCHKRAYDQYTVSMHSRSYANPVFQAQYFDEIIPRAMNEPAMHEEARQCLACHNPIAYMVNNEPILAREGSEKYDISGTCDFCHTINGIKGREPGNGNYISEPGPKKYGPHKTQTNWHHIYSPLQSSSAFCGTCHNDNNHKGLEIKSTYTEWKESVYARKGVSCQDCHMSVIGYLSKDSSVFERGKAVESTMLLQSPDRAELHTHTFPGAYSTQQISGAIRLQMKLNRNYVSPGQSITVRVRVDSRRSGHKIPTGSTDLRLLWLELNVTGGGKSFLIKASSVQPEKDGFDVSGMGQWDAEIIGDSIAEGNRLYRQIFLDEKGKQTISSVEAVKSIFDNRLEAAKTRVEKYRFLAPLTKDTYTITASLKYIAYPRSFSDRFNLPEAKTIEVASTTKELFVE